MLDELAAPEGGGRLTCRGAGSAIGLMLAGAGTERGFGGACRGRWRTSRCVGRGGRGFGTGRVGATGGRRLACAGVWVVAGWLLVGCEERGPAPEGRAVAAQERASVIESGNGRGGDRPTEGGGGQGMAVHEREGRMNDATETVASPERRVALVIGNGAYSERNARLQNSVKDAGLVRDALEDLDFEVMFRPDLSLEEMNGAAEEFKTLAGGAEVALFYYAGHGLELPDGTNYLVPVDAAADLSRARIPFRMFNANELQAMMGGTGARVRMIILDACRDNPFDGRSLGRGGGMGARGDLVAYSASRGQTASDDGLYAELLAYAMRTPGLTASALFDEVGGRIDALSAGRQTPTASMAGAVGTFVFRAGVDGAELVVASALVVRESGGYIEIVMRGPLFEAARADPLVVRFVPYPAEYGGATDWGHPAEVFDEESHPWPRTDAFLHGYVEFLRDGTLLHRIGGPGISRVGLAEVAFSRSRNVLSVYVSTNGGGASQVDGLTVVHYDLTGGPTRAESYGEGAWGRRHVDCSETQQGWTRPEPTRRTIRFEPCGPRDTGPRERFASDLRRRGRDVLDLVIGDRAGSWL